MASISRPEKRNRSRPEKVRARFWRVGLFGLIEAAGAIALFGTLLAVVARWHWLPELATHFRTHMGLALLLAAAAAAGRRQRRAATVFTLGLGLNLWVLAPGWWQKDVPTATRGTPLRLVSMNVLSSNHAQAAVLDFLRRQEADMLVLLEVNAAWAGQLAAFEADYPERVVVAREDNFGIALLSRLPLAQHEVLHLGATGLPSIAVGFDLDGHRVSLLATHPLPPISARHTAARDEQLLAAGKRLRADGGPAVLIGDFNTTPWAPGFKQLLQTSGLRDTLAGRGWQPTWPARLGWAGVPIDHCLVSPEWRVARRTVGPNLGSDHRPLLVDLRLP